MMSLMYTYVCVYRIHPFAKVDQDAMDDLNNPNAAHVYVTYDDPESRHTLAVARVAGGGVY